MPLFLASLVRWLGQRRLNTQLLILVLSVGLVGLSILGSLSYLRSQQQTAQEAQAWAQALARLTAKTAAGPLIEQDYGTLELGLKEIATLPGVTSLKVIGSGGQRVASIGRVAGDGLQIDYTQRAQREAPPSGNHHLQRGTAMAFASLITFQLDQQASPPTQEQWLSEGWVEIEMSYADRLAQSGQTWLAGAAGVLVISVIALLVFYRFLRHALAPIARLARFSAEMAKSPGAQLTIRWRSREVRELGRAINWSSKELAARMAETQLRLTRMRAILDTSADAILGVGEDGTIHSCNPAAERMFGRGPEAINGELLSKLLLDMDAESLSRMIAEGMVIHSTQSRIGRAEIEALRQDGTAFPVEVLLGEVNEDPQIRYTCFVRDLTDMKQAEEYLTLYGRVLDCTLNGIVISNARRFPQPIVHINPAFTRITGYAPHEMLGRDISILTGPQTDPDAAARLDRALQQGQDLSLTLKHYRQDKGLFHSKLSVSPVRDAHGEITHTIMVVEDVSSQIEVKRKLIERTARLNATFDLSPDGFVVFDAQGEMVSNNPALRNMVGQVPPWCSLQRFDIWFRNLCEDYEAYPLITASLNETAKHTLVLSLPTRRVLEREIRRSVRGSGETFVYFRDVTHQFEVDRMKSEFLATAAHELRTPLASILGFTELMIHRRYSEDKQKDLLQTVHRQGTLLSNLIQELLDLSRIEARQGKDFHIVPTSLTMLIKNTLDGVANRALGRDVALGELPDVHVMADAEKIQQALTNLVSNAFKYSPGEPKVSLDVELRQDAEGDCACVVVRDQGMGMTEDQLARVFERFYRADSSGNIPGTGLGLNLVKEIAEIHGGSVSLTSRSGEGTEATLVLRLATSPTGSAETETALDATIGS